MQDKNTYIKLYRSILDWEWYSDPNTLSVWIFLLCSANIESHRFMGVEIKRGELVTSYPNISKKTNLSIQCVRTAIKHLKLTGELTVKKHSKFSVISIKNYDAFQSVNRVSNSQLTVNQQSANSQLTPIKEYKNIRSKEYKKRERAAEPLPAPTISEVVSFFDDEKLNGNPETFYHYYSAENWKAKNGTTLNWKSAAKGWSTREKGFLKNNNSETETTYDLEEFEKFINNFN